MPNSDSLAPSGNSMIEIIRPEFPRGPFRAAIFDFDGTLSLLRRNWQDVMIPMMVRILQATGTSETYEELTRFVEDYVMRLNGRQTVYQMIRLAEEVAKRGATPREPLDYKNQYHDLLWKEVANRIQGVQEGRTPPNQMTVPGTFEMLQRLSDRGITLYLASGTDLKYVRNEVAVLGLEPYFGPRIYGALDDYKKFSKAMTIARIIDETGVAGPDIVGFGDGFVEIEEVKKVGGLAIGVASDEVRRTGINDWKRQRLIRAGADIVIGDYHCQNELLHVISLQ